MKPPKTSGAAIANPVAIRRNVGRCTWVSRTAKWNDTAPTISYYASNTTGVARDAGHRMIEVAGFSKTYEKVHAVESLSFSVAAGEVLGLVGPNGAGKTTTLRSLCGIIHPTAGTIRINGHDLRQEG